MSDLDEEEYKATRKLNGLDKEISNKDVGSIEEKVKRQTENTIKYYKNTENIEEVPIDILRAMYIDVLAEQEQDKKRIQELEKCKIVQDKNIRSGKPVIEGTRLTVIDVLLSMTKFIREHEKEFRKNHVDISSEQIITAIDYLLENSIPKQKVKDKLEELKQLKVQLPVQHMKEAQIIVLQELLEGGE